MLGSTTPDQRNATPTAYLPSNDPGDQGGGSHMGNSNVMAKEDFMNFFGPAGADVKPDENRHKRHQRWHLPDVLKGPNNFLTDRIDGIISDADSPFTTCVLPYKQVDNPDQKMSWDVYSYDEGLASRVPYESAARVLTQSKSTHSAYIVRQGLAISMEHNFMMSEAGRRDFNNQLLQLVGSIQYTNDLDVHMALITAPNYERTQVAKYAYSDTDPHTMLRKYIDMFGMCQKNPNGLDILIEDAKQVFKKWGASDPTFMICNPKLGYQQNMTVEKTQYLTNGIDGVKRLKAGPELKAYRGLSVINSRHFSMEAGRQPRDLLNRRVRVAEHYKLPPMSATEMADSSLYLYDEGKDQIVPISCRDLYTRSIVKMHDSHRTEKDPDADDLSFDEILELEKGHQHISPQFWHHLMYNPDNKCSSEAVAKKRFHVVLDYDPSKDNLQKENIQMLYHPKFLEKFHMACQDRKQTFESDTWTPTVQNIMNLPSIALEDPYIAEMRNAEFDNRYVKYMSRLKTLSETDRMQMHNWLSFMRREEGYSESPSPFQKTYSNEFASTHLWEKLTDEEIKGFFYAKYGPAEDANDAEKAYSAILVKNLVILYSYGVAKEGGHPGHKTFDGRDGRQTVTVEQIIYAKIMPCIANVYSDEAVFKLFTSSFASSSVPKYSLLVVRPSIEHYMLGVIVGRGGTGELGATLWGQTELSCYDDAMHGKWGMNYKYHARAVVFNEKNLLRLWDVAFNGYTGGMGVRMVDWNDTDEWHAGTVALDEPLKHEFPDMFVMRFDPQDELDIDMPNPINFSVSPNDPTTVSSPDPENIYNTHVHEMDVFANGTLSAKNTKRYFWYNARMPEYATMHAGRKTAGHASHEGDTHIASLSFSGTMQVKNHKTGQAVERRGTGHLGDSFAGCASVRAGNGLMAQGNPSIARLM